MNGSRKHTLVAGVALIAAVNILVLAGVAYNRSGEPECSLRLSERELRVPHVWRGSKENSGLALHLEWRVLPTESPASRLYPWRYSSYGIAPDWLNEAKMATLGFDISRQSNRIDSRRGYDRQLPRDVLLVLELNGAAYQAALARAAQYGGTGSDGEKVLKEEQEASSRLFVVDAGLDRAMLRAGYPDRGRYAIVRGQVRAAWQNKNKTDVLAGYVTDVSVSHLNVPLELKDAFDGAAETHVEREKKIVRYDVDVAFGQRLEAWITGAARKKSD